MIEDLHFLRDAVVDVDAAVVGIGRTRWISAEEGEPVEISQARMKEGGFDVLPIAGEPVRRYYLTEKWGDYARIEVQDIGYEDVIPLTTPIRLVIKGMADDRRSFYFLDSGARVVGLVTVANLNCRQVRTYLFSLIGELEMSMGDLLNRDHSEAELLKCDLDGRTKSRYLKDRKEGVDAPLTEYFYFRDFIASFLGLKLYRAMGYRRSDHFERHMKDLNDLRNEVAHPTKSLVQEPSDVRDLWSRVQRIERALFYIRHELNAAHTA